MVDGTACRWEYGGEVGKTWLSACLAVEVLPVFRSVGWRWQDRGGDLGDVRRCSLFLL